MASLTKNHDGTWLCPDGEYGNVIKDLCSSDPRLRNRDWRAIRFGVPWPMQHARLLAFKVNPDSSVERVCEYDSAKPLKHHLRSRRTIPDSDLGYVYILEGLQPEFVDTLGSHFRIHPSFFVEHERIVHFKEDAHLDCERDILPSMNPAREHFVLRYFEAIRLPENVRGIFRLYCAETCRHLAVTRFMGQFSEVGVLRRKCSVWRRRRGSGKGWDCKLRIP